MRDITHTDLELLYQLADGIDGEDADPGAAQELRDLEAAGRVSDSLCAGAWFTSSPRIGRGKPRLVG